MQTRVRRLLGDAYDDYMQSHSAAAMPAIASAPAPLTQGGFWSTVGTLLSNRGVVQVKTPQSNPVVNYAILGAAALGVILVASKS